METITELKEPVIELVKVDELSTRDLFRLNHAYKSDRSEFVICNRGIDRIIINAEHEKATELKELTKKIMNCRYLNSRTEKLMDSFEDIAGEKASGAMFDIRNRWVEERKKAEFKEQAEDILKQAKKKGIFQKAKKQEELIRMLFNIGFGLYEKGAKCNYNQGAQFCFAYGYMMGLQAADKKQTKE